MLVKYLSSTSAAKQRNNQRSRLADIFKRFEFSDEQIMMILLSMQPFLDLRIAQEVEAKLSHFDIARIEAALITENLDEAEYAFRYSQAYELSTGKTIEQLTLRILDEYAPVLVQAEIVIKEIIQQADRLDQAEGERLLETKINEILDNVMEEVN